MLIKDFFELTTDEHLVVSAGVDWITLTGDSQSSKERVGAFAMEMLEEGMCQGQKLHRTARSGYQLSSVEGIQWGTGHSGWMVCLYGETARKHWLPFYAYSKNCSRVDLQCTIAYRHYEPRIVEKLYREALGGLSEEVASRMSFITSGQRGQTLYYGSRTSSQYGRVYDKWKQSKQSEQFDGCIRFEVEYKKPLSSRVAADLCRDLPDASGITGMVLNWFAHRGINGPAVYTSSDNELEVGRKETSLEAKLAWLKQSVRPTYRQLRLAGFQTEVDEAIGVTENIETINDEGAKEPL